MYVKLKTRLKFTWQFLNPMLWKPQWKSQWKPAIIAKINIRIVGSGQPDLSTLFSHRVVSYAAVTCLVTQRSSPLGDIVGKKQRSTKLGDNEKWQECDLRVATHITLSKENDFRKQIKKPKKSKKNRVQSPVQSAVQSPVQSPVQSRVQSMFSNCPS